MFSRPAQHLCVQSPSSTTVSYTVSNASSDVTRSSIFFSYLRGVLRVLVCTCVLLVDLATAEVLLGSRPWNTFVTFGFVENAARAVPRRVDWRVIVGFSFAILYLCLRRSYTGTAFGIYRRYALKY
jgi:hypothetical protein